MAQWLWRTGVDGGSDLTTADVAAYALTIDRLVFLMPLPAHRGAHFDKQKNRCEYVPKQV
jgi:hypothetical protein